MELSGLCEDEGPGGTGAWNESAPLALEVPPRLTPGAFLLPFCAGKKELAARRNLAPESRDGFSTVSFGAYKRNGLWKICPYGKPAQGRQSLTKSIAHPLGVCYTDLYKTLDKKSMVRCSLGWAKNSWGSFCSRMWPPSMNSTRVPTSRAKPISWVTTTMVMPSWASSFMT